MDKQLKKQRNKIFLRVSLVLLAVWFLVSAFFISFCLYNEYTNSQNAVLSKQTNFERIFNNKPRIKSDYKNNYIPSGALFKELNVLFDDGLLKESNSQIVVIENITGVTVANTAGKKEVVKFGLKNNGFNSISYGLIDLQIIRDSLTDEQFKEITDYLSIKRNDGKKYELVCTKFQFVYYDVIPLELKVIINSGSDMWFISDEVVASYKLDENTVARAEIYECNDMLRNTIPTDLLLNKTYNEDYIGQLSDEQLEKSFDKISTGFLNYTFYFSEINQLSISEDEIITEDEIVDILVRYAKHVNLGKECNRRILIGVSVIFLFFFLIALVLCFMIWKMVKSQIIQEKKRADLTNALAHDIKTPLFVISGCAYSMKDGIDGDERGDYLDKIINQTDNINEMVHKMLNLSKLDSYMMKLNKTDFDLFALVEEVCENYVHLPDGKQLLLSHSGDNTVNADRELIKTAVQNLTDNAVKYSTPQGVIKVEVTGKRLVISNPSEPLSKAEIKQLWEPYARKDKSRSKSGNGLGLAIVKSILDLHKAKYGMYMKASVLTFYAEF